MSDDFKGEVFRTNRTLGYKWPKKKEVKTFIFGLSLKMFASAYQKAKKQEI
jgi:hypothetical protein